VPTCGSGQNSIFRRPCCKIPESQTPPHNEISTARPSHPGARWLFCSRQSRCRRCRRSSARRLLRLPRRVSALCSSVEVWKTSADLQACGGRPTSPSTCELGQKRARALCPPGSVVPRISVRTPTCTQTVTTVPRERRVGRARQVPQKLAAFQALAISSRQVSPNKASSQDSTAVILHRPH
jgi:hypothetical protein